MAHRRRTTSCRAHFLLPASDSQENIPVHELTGISFRQCGPVKYRWKPPRKKTHVTKHVSPFIFSLLILLPISAHGQFPEKYISIKPGVYYFTGDLEDDHPMGFFGGVFYGFRLFPNLVLESGTGYFHDGDDGNDIRGVPVTLTLKGIYPFKNLVPYAGGGIGIYFTEYFGNLNGRYEEDKDNVFGGHLIIGAEYNITPMIFLGVEGMYIFTEDAEYNGVKVNLDGFATLMTMGFRF